MKISNYAIDRPRVVLVISGVVLAFALWSALKIPVQRTPAITKAVVLVAVPYPGAQPTEVEEQITRKIEDRLQRLQNVDFIASTSMRGSSVTQVIFLDGVDPDTARGEVKDLVDQVRNELPQGREIQPVVTDIDFENTPLILVTMTSPDGFDQRALNRIAEEVQEELEAVAGVANTQIYGGREREIHVDVDLDLANQYGLTLADFQQVLSKYHAPLPGGALNTKTYDFQVRNETKLKSVEDIREIIIRHSEGRVIRLGEVAQVSDTYRRLINVAHLDGHDCATFIVNKEADINSLKTATQVREKVEDLKNVYPDIVFATTRDTSVEISVMFRVLGSSFVFGAMLVLIILAWSMGLRVSILVLMAIPMSSAVGLIVLHFLDISVSNMVIFAFILVLGMVVDGAIIVAENIHRHIERGEDPVTASKLGIEEVGMPVIMADLTTVAAYLPMLLVPGIMGDFLSVMPKVVSVSLLGSILVDHFVIPTIAARWYRKRELVQHNGMTVVFGGNVDSDDAPTAEVRVRPKLGPISRGYAAILNWSLDNSWAIVVSTGLAIVLAIKLYHQLDSTFFPTSDRGQFEVKYELPLGSSIHETIAASKAITDPLQELKDRDDHLLVHFVSAIGSSEGLTSRLENDPAVGPEFGTIMVELLSPLDRTVHEQDIIAELRKKFDANVRLIPGMKYSIHEVEEGPPGGHAVAVRLTGDDLPHLGRTAKSIAASLDSVDGTLDVGHDYRDENPEIVVNTKPWVIGMFDLTNRDVSQAVQTAINGDTSILMSIGDEDVTLRLQAASRYQQNRRQLERLVLTSPTGKKATLGEVAELTRTTGLYAANRYERKRAVVARCDVTATTTPDNVFNALRNDILPKLGFKAVQESKNENEPEVNEVSKSPQNPIEGAMGYEETPENPTGLTGMIFIGKPGTEVEGIRARFTGENEERDKNFNYLLSSMAIAVILIFMILVLQFNSFRQTGVVLITVPLSFIGVIAGMWACDFPFSLASFIGLVSLTGIVVNDAIVVVDFINQARQRGLPLRDSIIEAGVNRLRPVILTTVTTIGGLLPLFLNISGGAEFWQPLTGAVCFGLGFATILTLIVIPVAYYLVYRFLPEWRSVDVPSEASEPAPVR